MSIIKQHYILLLAAYHVQPPEPPTVQTVAVASDCVLLCRYVLKIANDHSN